MPTSEIECPVCEGRGYVAAIISYLECGLCKGKTIITDRRVGKGDRRNYPRPPYPIGGRVTWRPRNKHAPPNSAPSWSE